MDWAQFSGCLQTAYKPIAFLMLELELEIGIGLGSRSGYGWRLG